MNKTLMFAAAAAFTCALAFGQSPVVSLQNQEDSSFYYVVDPQELAGLSAGSPLLASKVAGYFSAASTGATFSLLAPQAEVKLTGLAEGTHLLVGFFAQLDADDFPVRVVALQADSSVGERFYAVFASPAQLSVRRGVGKLAQFARPAATQGATVASSQGAAPAGSNQPAVDTTSLPAIATFSSAYEPTVFTRESSSSFNVLPISESHAWSQTGTRIASLQGNLDSTGLKLVLNVPGGFSPSVSYFLYFFDARVPGRENPLTLEIEPVARSDRGVCILWQKDSAPRLLGNVKTSGTSVELDVGADDLASGVLAAAGNTPTVDLTAGWYDKALGIWEEFFYATFTAPSMGATR
ncbi:MAG: hypothetical protein ABSG21_01700 [Spirochaetia bacterium]|jgi:hypothetical protein